MAKQRLDQLLLARGLVESRARAQALIMAGEVFSGERKLDKAGMMLAEDAPLRLKNEGPSWVSRGAHKLIAGLDAFAIDPAGLLALDVGASTGGFTDVLLARGAARVIAVDVGHGQLHWKLRSDERVEVMERCNARYLTREQIPTPPDLVVCDASFIGLRTVLPAALELAAADAVLVALIKPQFEVGKGEVGKGGVVRDPAMRQAACDTVRDWLEEVVGWTVRGIVPSPILGPKGNQEFLIVATRGAPGFIGGPPRDAADKPFSD